MATPICVPDLGTTEDEVRVMSWLVKAGDTIRRGDVIAEVETDKAVVDFESPAEGVVLKLAAAPDDMVRTGDILAWVGQPGEAVPEEPPRTVGRGFHAPPEAARGGTRALQE